MPNNPIPALLRVGEAAKLLNVQTSTIRAWVLRRKLPYVRIGTRAIRIPLDAVESIIRGGTIPARHEL
jgi:excisionase family DNA binding protein